jgi:hypothetical protein
VQVPGEIATDDREADRPIGGRQQAPLERRAKRRDRDQAVGRQIVEWARIIGVDHRGERENASYRRGRPRRADLPPDRIEFEMHRFAPDLRRGVEPRLDNITWKFTLFTFGAAGGGRFDRHERESSLATDRP